MGVDPIKNLVVPRFLALMLVTGLFDIYALLFGIFGGVLATAVNHAPLGPFFATLANNAEPTDLWASVLKTTLFGAIIAIVGCYYGFTASGGPVGVGVGVATAKSMVVNLVSVHIIGMLGTQLFWGANPRAPIGG
jgi:phospholipid/cholesterol/gamma-HCH transport system permease protein